MEAVLIRVVGAELRGFLDHRPVTELAGDRAGLAALPALAGLDAEQVVAAAAVLGTHHRLTPTGFQGGLGHQVFGVDTDTRGGGLGHRQHGGDKFVLGAEGFLRRRQGRLGHGTAIDLHAAARNGKRASAAVDHIVGRDAVTQRRSLGQRRGIGARHDAGQQTVGQLAGQGEATLVHQRHIVGVRTGAFGSRHAVSPEWALAVGATQRAFGLGAGGNLRRHIGFLHRLGGRRALQGGRLSVHRFVLLHLAHQHVGQADAAAFARHRDRQLLVVHFLVLLGRRRVQRVVLAQGLGGRTHGLEHLAQKQRLELLRHLAHVAVAVLVANLQLVQAIQVRIRPRIRRAGQATVTHVHGHGLKSRSGRLATRRPASKLQGSPSSRLAPPPPGSPHARFHPGWCRGRI